MSEPYLSPVDRLLSLGEDAADADPWPEYLELGIGEEHVPELIRMMLDRGPMDSDEGDPAAYAFIHAWRALGQLRAEAAVGALIDAVEVFYDVAWAWEELPEVFAMIGRPAIPALAACLADPVRDTEGRTTIAQSLKEIAEAHEEARAEAVAALAGQMEKWEENDESLNGMLILFLANLGVTEAAPLMERAFAADRVDELIGGDWEDTQVRLGLLPERPTRRRRVLFHELGPSAPPAESYGGRSPKKNADAKRKMAKASRKKNRRRR